MLSIRELSMQDYDVIKELFLSVFTAPPWNDDWGDARQLDEYLMDLICVRTPLDLGLYDDDTLIGMALGSIRHWWSGTEYYIDELCIRADRQGRGVGTNFMRMIEEMLPGKGVTQIFLQTERTAPAFGFYMKNGFTDMPEHVSLYKELGKE